jgi:small-conductance mechanosensitive channel
METIYLGNSLYAWAVAGVVFLVAAATMKLLKDLADRKLHGLAQKTNNKVDDLFAEMIVSIRGFFLIIVSLYAASYALDLPEQATWALRTAVVLAVLLQLALSGSRGISYWLDGYVREKQSEDASSATTMNAIGYVSKLALWAVVFILILDNLGVDISALIAGLGIGGIAVALAAQNILGDLFASLSIVLDKPFIIGDFIIVGDMMGTVEKIGIKTTRIRSLSGEQLIFSNIDLLTSRIRNYKQMFERRIVFGFGVTYDTPPEKLEVIPGFVKDMVESLPDTRFDRAHFAAYGDSSLNFEVVYYVLLPDYAIYMDRQQSINLALYRRLQEMGVEFAFPTRTLYVKSEPAKAS